ncbi:MAG: hypothetical protein ABI779_02545 [Acidobacteriota bacterium]
MTSSDRRIAAGLFLLTFVTYAYFFNGGGWNQNAQFDLARALVERQTLHIDGYRVNTGDISWSPVSGQWHAYINKPPGVSFLAAIPYALVYAVEHAAHVPVDQWFWVTLNAWIVTILTCGVTGALIPVLLFEAGRRAQDAAGRTSDSNPSRPVFRALRPVSAMFIALAMAFGTIAFPFSTMLFAHVPAAFFLLLAFVWLDKRPLLAGVAAGIAGLCFYICIPAAAVLFIGSWVRSRRNALRFALGGIPFGLLLGAYHQACFGSPFVTSVETSSDFTEKGLLFGVFRLPSMEALWGLTFSEYRGLFFVSPILLLAFVGAVVMVRQRVMRRELFMIAAVAAIFFFTIAGFNGWSGGGSFGPRYLLPIVPLLGIPLFFVPRRVLLFAGVPLALAALAMQLAATAVDPTLHAGIFKPVQTLFADLLAGNTSTNPQALDELIPYQRYAHGSHESVWASFNVGEFLTGPSNPASILPIVLWIALGSVYLLRRAASAPDRMAE